MPARAQPSPRSKQETVFRAAKAVFIEKGFDGASMDDVARKAGATKVTVYAHGRTKAALFEMVVREAVGLSVAKLEPPDRDLPLDDALTAFLHRYRQIVCWSGSIGLQRAVIAVQDRFPDLARLMVEEVVERAEDMLAGYLSETTKGDARVTAKSMIAAATGERHIRTLLGALPELTDVPGQEPQDGRDPAIALAISVLTRQADCA